MDGTRPAEWQHVGVEEHFGNRSGNRSRVGAERRTRIGGDYQMDARAGRPTGFALPLSATVV